MDFNRIAILAVVLPTILTFSCDKTSLPDSQVSESTSTIPHDSTSLIVAIDPLPSWNNTAHKKRILNFVKAITDSTGKSYVKPSARIATFDNDGTLWSEQPHYFQLQFTFDRIVAMAPEHPKWKRDKLIQAVLDFDKEKILSFGGEGIFRLITITHSDVSTEEFNKIVSSWINNARHPKTGKRYKEMVYQPMLELIHYLQANEFEVYIVSGSWVDFLRPWSEEVYSIPKEQVIGSRQQLSYKLVNGKPILKKLSEVDFINNEANKVIAIHQIIGKRPIFTFGNSDGDIQMLEWTSAGKGKRLSGIIHHTDAKREWAYDTNASFGRLDEGLSAATKNNWLVIDMKKDWRVIYPYNLKDN